MDSYVMDGGTPRRERADLTEAVAPPLSRRWRTPVEQGFTPQRPLKSGGRVIVTDSAIADERSTLLCFAADDGRVLWRQPADTPGMTALLCVAAGVGLLACPGSDGATLTAYDIETGAKRWSLNSTKPQRDDAVIAGARVVLAGTTSGERQVVAIDPATGAIAWRRGYGEFVRPRAVSSRGIVCLRNHPDGPGAGMVLTISPDDGAIVWQQDVGERFPYVDGDRQRQLGTISEVTSDGARLYCQTIGPETITLDLETGEVAWVRQVADGAKSAAAVADGRLYFTSYDDFWCLDASTGAELYRVPLDPKFGSVKTSGFLAGDYYYYSRSQYLCAHDRRTGALAWSFEGESVFWPPFVSGGRLYAGSADGAVHCWEPAAAR
jgi:outer membrane protein assembly factor BamB